MISCYQCGKQINIESKLSFREECPFCQSDLHTCFNCRFYNETAYNECNEPSAEPVKDKDRNNYCEYFDLQTNKKNSPSSADKERKKQMEAAEALFKKD